MSMYYSLQEYDAVVGTAMPSGTDVGYLYLPYQVASPDDQPARTRIAMITNGDGTFDFVSVDIAPDGTLSNFVLDEGMASGFWPDAYKAAGYTSYARSMTRAEFNQFVTDWNV